jgi:hypothetical protein
VLAHRRIAVRPTSPPTQLCPDWSAWPRSASGFSTTPETQRRTRTGPLRRPQRPWLAPPRYAHRNGPSVCTQLRNDPKVPWAGPTLQTVLRERPTPLDVWTGTCRTCQQPVAEQQPDPVDTTLQNTTSRSDNYPTSRLTPRCDFREPSDDRDPSPVRNWPPEPPRPQKPSCKDYPADRFADVDVATQSGEPRLAARDRPWAGGRRW